jgi:transcriptional regulator with XRE-family HTH domain
VPAYRSSATQAAREALAGRLRELRIDAGLTAIQLATAAGWHRTKVSRIEHADRQPSIADVHAWCAACGVADQADDLAAAVRSIESIYVQWQRLQRTGLRRLQEAATTLHQQTRLLRYYESQVIPGSLQTSEYARQVLGAVVEFYGAPDDAAEAADSRAERQRFLRDGAHRSMFVIEESVLRSTLGGADVMAAQLGHLLELMSLPTVSLGVIPFGVRRSGFTVESFALYDSSKVEVELVSAQVTITAPSEIKLYAKAFEELAGMAAYGAAARSLITSALSALDD